MLHVTPSPLLSERTTMRLGGPALAEVRITEAVDACALSKVLEGLGGHPLVLGAGSNILAGDGAHALVLVRPCLKQEPVIQRLGQDQEQGQEQGRDGERVLVRVGSGVRMPRLLGVCAKWGLGGLQGLCGIPGTVGGAVAMNAGSFGCETGPLVHSMRIYAPSLGVTDIDAKHIRYSYRSLQVLGLNEWFLILHVTFGLTQTKRDGITESMRHNFFKKKSTQPISAWSAGCVFKNPSPQQAAGMLLEQAGFRGRRLGGMAFSEVHANFLVNEGRGSATAALELMAQARDAVLDRFGVCLEPEVRVLTCPSS